MIGQTLNNRYKIIAQLGNSIFQLIGAASAATPAAQARAFAEPLS
jgi:hypothetical protein